jgi:hypothetical protein
MGRNLGGWIGFWLGLVGLEFDVVQFLLDWSNIYTQEKKKKNLSKLCLLGGFYDGTVQLLIDYGLPRCSAHYRSSIPKHSFLRVF